MLRTLLSIFILLFLSSCSEQELLISSVSESDSVQIMVVLQDAGILAERTLISASKEPRYQIQVDPSHYKKALNILNEYGLPKQESDNLSSITEPKGFTPNPPEINLLRLDHALSFEIERLLTVLPGVVGVKALVRSNFANTEEQKQSSSVSVLIRYRSDNKKLPFSREDVEKIISQGVPNLDASSIHVSAYRITNLTKINEQIDDYVVFPPFRFRVKKDDVNQVKQQLSLAFGIFCFVGGLVGIILGWKFSRRGVNRQLAEAQTIIETAAREALPEFSSEE